ncbi:MAG: proton-conducting transporter membrane subunit [Halieaceae bacterium]|jgi:formate hydrogenlyase subunit 3/multisubunit Na+/H+ antiporter MnhD subunit|nr:proton-conducting transporter membrane subunit [Halieaceae bacterium]
MPLVAPHAMTTPGGLLLVLLVLLPFLGVLVGFVLGAGNARRVALVTLVPGLGIAIASAAAQWQSGAELVYLLGGWPTPLGVALRADGLSVVMLVAVAAVIGAIGIYARADFTSPQGAPEARKPFTFWLLLLAVWGSLNLVFVSGDLFTLYVALELLTFAGVPLVCLDGRGETLRAALRYLLFALLGSMLYLLGAALLYGAYGTLDIALLAAAVRPGPVAWTVLALMTGGLLAKTALFPLHIWLPPAHAGAPAAASAILSALVIKGSWFLVVRLWFDVMPGVVTLSAAQLLGALGAAAIVFGSVAALRQQRLKLLVAYSTMAQIGYLFLMFPLAFDVGVNALAHGAALDGGLLQAVSHATAKASMFMAAGLIYAALGHDRIADLAGVGRAMPVTVLAFALAGIALMGVLPSGAYLAKKLMLDAADDTGQWWWTLVLEGGAVFTAGYVVLVLVSVLRRRPGALPLQRTVARSAEYAALALAVSSFLLALAALGPVPGDFVSNPLAFGELATTLLVVLGGTVLALGLARRPIPGDASTAAGANVSPLRRMAEVAGSGIERADLRIRGWAVASTSLLLLSGLFGGLLFYGASP